MFVGGQFALIDPLVFWQPRRQWSIPDALDTMAGVTATVRLAWMAVGALSLGRPRQLRVMGDNGEVMGASAGNNDPNAAA